jgi:hypothetical protein
MKNSAPKMSARDRISEIALQTKAPAFVIGLIKPEVSIPEAVRIIRRLQWYKGNLSYLQCEKLKVRGPIALKELLGDDADAIEFDTAAERILLVSRFLQVVEK